MIPIFGLSIQHSSLRSMSGIDNRFKHRRKTLPVMREKRFDGSDDVEGRANLRKNRRCSGILNELVGA